MQILTHWAHKSTETEERCPDCPRARRGRNRFCYCCVFCSSWSAPAQSFTRQIFFAAKLARARVPRADWLIRCVLCLTRQSSQAADWLERLSLKDVRFLSFFLLFSYFVFCIFLLNCFNKEKTCLNGKRKVDLFKFLMSNGNEWRVSYRKQLSVGKIIICIYL